VVKQFDLLKQEPARYRPDNGKFPEDHERDGADPCPQVEDGWSRYSFLSLEELLNSNAIQVLSQTYPAVNELVDRARGLIKYVPDEVHV